MHPDSISGKMQTSAEEVEKALPLSLKSRFVLDVNIYFLHLFSTHQGEGLPGQHAGGDGRGRAAQDVRSVRAAAASDGRDVIVRRAPGSQGHPRTIAAAAAAAAAADGSSSSGQAPLQPQPLLRLLLLLLLGKAQAAAAAPAAAAAAAAQQQQPARARRKQIW